jgi:hypothetical protein
MIRAGTTDEIRADTGKWVIIDIGFANNARSCGLLIDNERPVQVRFGEAVHRICTYLSVSSGPVNLLIEAPLSVAFDCHKNPKGRSVEMQGRRTRYWYINSGCVVMVAALYLVRKIVQENPDADVRLFEGFVSFHEQRNRANHCSDVVVLREVIDNPNKYSCAIVSSDSLKIDETDTLLSTFLVAGIDAGITPIIMRNG